MIIRLVEAKDITAVHALVAELAEKNKFEKFNTTEQYFIDNFIGDQRYADLYVIDIDGDIAGMVHVVKLASTYIGSYELYLRDFIIAEPYRHKGYGKQLVQFISQLAKDRNCEKIRWTVYDWNKEILGLYSKVSKIEHDVVASVMDFDEMG